jgi:hypothetical protein
MCARPHRVQRAIHPFAGLEPAAAWFDEQDGEGQQTAAQSRFKR